MQAVDFLQPYQVEEIPFYFQEIGNFAESFYQEWNFSFVNEKNRQNIFVENRVCK